MTRSGLVARNVIVTLATQLVSWILAFAVMLYLPRYLQDTGLGAITLAGSYAAIFSLMVALGTSTVLVKEIAKDHSRVGELVNAALIMRATLGVVTVVIGGLVAALLRYDRSIQILVCIALGVMVVGQLGDVLISALGGLEEFPRQSVGILVGKVLSAALTIALVFARAPIWTFVAVAIVGCAGSMFVCGAALRKFIKRMTRPQRSTIRFLARAGVPFLWMGVFVAIYGQSDALLLAKLSSIAAIGWYGVAKRLVGPTMVIPVTLSVTMLPTLTRMFHRDEQSFISAVNRLLNLSLVCVVPFSAVLVMAPGRLLSLLHYPAAFRHSIPVLIVAGAAVVLWYVSQVVSTALIASDRQNLFSRITGYAALACVPVCTACIVAAEHFCRNGALGAMFSDCILELGMVIAYIRALPGGIVTRRSVLILARGSAAAIPLILALYNLSGGRGIGLVLVAAILYIPLCWTLRCFEPADIAILRQAVCRIR